MVIQRAKGARIWDADEQEYLDFMLGFSTNILGNTPEEVQEAIREALPRGTQYGQCHEREYAFARLFCEMVPGVEKVTFCNSGTEATLYACRLARALTGRPLMAKFEGVHIAPHHGFMSTAHTDEDITRLIETHQAAMQELRAKCVW